MLSFSTCWNAHRHEDGEHLINEILLLGFEAVELSHGFTRQLITGFRKGFDQGRIKVSGATYPVPARPKNSDQPVAELLSSDPSTHKQAIQQIITSINQVDGFEGDYLILRFGSLPECADSQKLVEMLRVGEVNSRDYVTEKLALIEAREQIADPVMVHVRRALLQLVAYAEARGVRLALENRSRYEQFPTMREIEYLLAEIDNPSLGYWHDFGHAARQAQLGFLDHAEVLERLAPRLIGCHVNDLIWPDQDHAVPGQGEIDFSTLIEGLPSDTHMVWEIEQRRKTADIKAALAKWIENFPPIVIKQIQQATRFVRENDFATVRAHVLSHDTHPMLQFVKYGVCGVGAFLVHVVAVNILGATVFPFHDGIADAVRRTNTMINNSLGFLVSCAFAYWTNINFVFKSGRHGRKKEISLFFAISGISFFAGLATVPVIFDLILEHFTSVGKYAQHIATLGFAVTSALVNFVCRKFIIFDK